MAAKSLDWQPGPTVCRCCLTEGCYKDISTEYFWMGKREVYAEMLSETFDVTISYAQMSTMNSNSRLICEPCISRLRDATDFKRQVLDCERTFHQYLNPQKSLAAEASAEQDTEPDVKMSTVKVEVTFSDDEVDTSAPFQDDDDDDLDDEPLTKLATKIPKRESVDYRDLEDNAKAVKRKSTSKDKPTPAKKPKKKETVKQTVKASASKSTAAPKPEKKKKEETTKPERRSYPEVVEDLSTPERGSYTNRDNAELLIKNTTAYPFRVNFTKIICVFCGESHEDPEKFRQHIDKEHQTFGVGLVFKNLVKSEPIKVDIKGLKCRLCLEPLSSLDKACSHLINEHGIRLLEQAGLGLVPYLLEKDDWKCFVCDRAFSSILSLNRHTVTHYQSYVCYACGKRYFASTGLIQHEKRMHSNEEAFCKRCERLFPTMAEKLEHHKTDKRCMNYTCVDCNEKFPTWNLKRRHMAETHDFVEKSFPCTRCDVVFPSKTAFYCHFRLRHAQHSVCTHCGKSYPSKSKLNHHIMIRHGDV